MGKIEKIRAEIERQMKFYDEKEMKAWDDSEQGDEDALWYQGHRKMCAKLLTFLDTLSEESDKSLDEEIRRYYREECSSDDEPTTEEIARHFAEWQEEQFEKNRLAHCDALSKEDYDRETDFAMEIIENEHRQPTFLDAINYGMRLQKEQMLKDAYVESRIVEDGRIELEGNPLPCLNPIILLPYPQFKPGDKVKLIIVKEDK